MTQQYPILEISGDFDGDGVDEEAVFEMPDATVTPRSIASFLAEIGGSGVSSLLNAQVLGNKGEQIAIDAGGGPRVWEIQWEGWTESNDYQWGTSPSPGLSDTSATGEDRISQVCILNEWLHRVDIGSNNPARLYWGEYSDSTSFADSGVYASQQIAISESSLPVPKEQSSIYEGSLNCVAVSDLNELTDAVSRTG